ncbi:MAG: DUF3526 domain-containing protein [Pseudomonadota bacterium]
MSQILAVAADEWRFWQRSNLVRAAVLLLALVLIAAAVLTAVQIVDDTHERTHYQDEAEATFLAQPDRHPHRMVHYGHYVFRTPAPLAVFDPGLDPVTGQTIFLEGHRQNTAMGGNAAQRESLGAMPSLSPAFFYQFFAPLLLILVGHHSLVRERESQTLAPLLALGLGSGQLLLGKGLALAAIVAALLLPAALVLGGAVFGGASAPVAAVVLGSYALYLSIWACAVLLASAVFTRRSTALASLLAGWLVVTLLLPAIAVNQAALQSPTPGKTATDFEMQQELAELGDGHNAADPAFTKLRDELLAQYGVTEVEALPVNLRGVVAEQSEADLTALMNRYAEDRFAATEHQAAHAARYGWLSPYLAVGFASRALAGTDLATHHRFLREAEAERFAFVQGLNRVHASELSYLDDINRNTSDEASRRSRVSADNWAVLTDFHFEPAKPTERLVEALPALLMLGLWLVLGVVALAISSRRLTP